MFIRDVMPTLEEAREFYSDVFFVYWGFRPDHVGAEPSQSSFILRTEADEILKMMSNEIIAERT